MIFWRLFQLSVVVHTLLTTYLCVARSFEMRARRRHAITSEKYGCTQVVNIIVVEVLYTKLNEKMFWDDGCKLSANFSRYGLLAISRKVGSRGTIAEMHGIGFDRETRDIAF